MANHNPPANKTPQAKIDFIRDHLNERPRTMVARQAGVSMGTLYRIVRELGGGIDHSRCYRHPAWWDDYIREHYPNESARDIAKAIGSIKNRVNKIASELGVRHSETYLAKRRIRNVERMKRIQAESDPYARSRKAQHERHMDEVRIAYGLPRKTKFRLKTISKPAYKSKWNLIRKYNYFADEAESYTLYYDNNTRRTPREQYHTKRYGLEFKPAE